MSPLPPGTDQAAEVLAKGIGATLSRILSSIPGTLKSLGRAVSDWRRSRRPEAKLSLFPLGAAVTVSAADRANIEFTLLASNFGKWPLEADRLELDSVSIGGRNLQRNADMVKVRGDVGPNQTSTLWFTINISGSEVATLTQGIGKANNPLSSPQALARIYGQILFLRGHQRFRKPVNFQWESTNFNVATAAVQPSS